MAIKLDVIKRATRNFKPDLFLGEGRSGPVYKGIIDELPLTAMKLVPGIFVAVKKLNVELLIAGFKESLVHFFVSFGIILPTIKTIAGGN